MYLVDLKTGELAFYETNGEPSSVGIDFWKFVEKHPDKEFAFVHNHNIVSSLSQPDLQTPIVCQSISTQIAVQNDGVKYMVKRTKDAVEKFHADLRYETALKELNELSRSGKISAAERTVKREEILIRQMVKEFYEGGIVVIDGRRNK